MKSLSNQLVKLSLTCLLALTMWNMWAILPTYAQEPVTEPTNGTLTIEILDRGQWQLAGELAYDKYLTEGQLELASSPPFLNGALSGPIWIRVKHTGNTAAHIDAVLLNGAAPTQVYHTAEETALALKKLAARDYDVIDAQGKSLVFSFDRPEAFPTTLSLTARIEPVRITQTPFQFPPANLFQTMSASSTFYTYVWNSQPGRLTIDGDLSGERLNQPFFMEFSQTGTGHPSNYTYGWVRNDADTLYVAIDFVPDNTMDGDKDYAKVYVNTPAGLRSFKASVPEQQWGMPGFTYTPHAGYQHKVYEFAIPLNELGLSELSTGAELELAFAAYGTAAPQDIALIGNGQTIANGDTSPSALDDTDFGSLSIGNSLNHTFTIGNSGGADLTLSNLSLTYATSFSVTQPASTTLAFGQSTTFDVTFAPQSVGSFTDTVTILSNDPDESPYTFVISGTGACPSPTPSRIYVDQSATLGNDDGSSWDDAYLDLQDGLALARTCAITEIWVATGVYTPGLSQSDTFTLTSGISLYGGFAGTESQRTERDWEANVTVLSGDIAGDDTTDANGVVTDTANISDSNNYHVVWIDGVTDPITETTTLDGFTITAGQANGSGDDAAGGGMYCNGVGNECSPSLNNLIFSGNAAKFAGALANDGTSNGLSSPSLNNVIFSANTATFSGGAMFNLENSSPDLSNVTFSGNSASDGGAMYNDGTDGDSSPNLTNVTFSENSASNDGGAMYSYAEGGGSVSNPSLITVTFSGNWSDDDGGAMANEGNNNGVSSPSLDNVTFSGNTTADSGGAMYNYGNGGISSPSLNNVTFYNNSTADSGGALYNNSNNGTSNPSLVNVTFLGNAAADKGGAMSSYGNNSGTSSPDLVNVIFSGNSADYGGAMASYTANNGTSSPSLSNVTFSGNTATEEGGALFNRGLSGGVATPNLSNVIVWGNTAITGTQFYNITATLTISYSLIQSDTTNAIVNDTAGSVVYGSNILTDDPLFVDDDGADDTAGTLDDDLRLSDDSPAVDAGNNDAIALSTDLDGNSRFYDDTGVTDTGSGAAPIVDMGAYEKQSNSSTPIYLPIVMKDD